MRTVEGIVVGGLSCGGNIPVWYTRVSKTNKAKQIKKRRFTKSISLSLGCLSVCRCPPIDCGYCASSNRWRAEKNNPRQKKGDGTVTRHQDDTTTTTRRA